MHEIYIYVYLRMYEGRRRGGRRESESATDFRLCGLVMYASVRFWVINDDNCGTKK